MNKRQKELINTYFRSRKNNRTPFEWLYLIKIKKVHPNEIGNWAVLFILEKKPELKDMFINQLYTFHTYEAASLLMDQPQFIHFFKKYGNINNLDAFNLNQILKRQPQLIHELEDYLDLLHPNDLNDLMIYPEIKNFFNSK